MSRRKAQVPSLADTLAKGFAELKSEDEDIPPSQEVIVAPEVQEVVDEEQLSTPEYGGPTQHVAQQSSFIVSSKKADQPLQEDSEQPKSEEVEILERPSSSIGDDFDVEW